MKKLVLSILLILPFIYSCSTTLNSAPVYSLQNLKLIEKNPEKHKGKIVAFYGKAFNVKETDKGTIFQMLVKDSKESFDSEVIACIYPGNGTELLYDDAEIKILGFITGEVKGKNAFGATISMPLVSIIAVDNLEKGQYNYLVKYEALVKNWINGTPVENLQITNSPSNTPGANP